MGTKHVASTRRRFASRIVWEFIVNQKGYRTFRLENTALVLIDHQVGTINWAGELASETEREQLKMWVRALTRFASGVGMPIVMTSSMETQAQGLLLPDLAELAPAAYAARVQRVGVINAWDDPAFAAAVRATGRPKLLMGGLTTDVCLVPPALSAQEEGFDVVALMDISAACTRIAAQNCRDILTLAQIDLMTTTPMITQLLGDYTHPASGAFFEAFGREGIYDAFASGNLR